MNRCGFQHAVDGRCEGETDSFYCENHAQLSHMIAIMEDVEQDPQDFHEMLVTAKGDLFKASKAYCKARGWHREDWYLAWQTTGLPDLVEQAVRQYLTGSASRP